MTNASLIIQPGAIGDCILTVPLLRMLRAIGPVDVMGHPERLALLQGRSEVGKILPLETPGLHELFADCDTFAPSAGPLTDMLSGYELIVTFLADEKGKFQRNLQRFAGRIVAVELRPPNDWPGHAAEFFVQQVREQLPDFDLPDMKDLLQGPLLCASEADRLHGQSLLAEHNIDADGGRVIAMQPGSGGTRKCWPLENFRAIADELANRGYQVVMLLGPAELERWPGAVVAAIRSELAVIENADLTDVAAVLSCCCGYLGNDSGITHLAAALGTPTLAVFGPSNRTHWQPLGEQAHIAHGEIGLWPDVGHVLSGMMYRL